MMREVGVQVPTTAHISSLNYYYFKLLYFRGKCNIYGHIVPKEKKEEIQENSLKKNPIIFISVQNGWVEELVVAW